jgi:acyl dehydratase
MVMSVRFFEDFAVGDRFATGSVTIGESDILEFGRRYDPQPFHIDPAAAKESIFGGLIASGFQTLASGFRLIWDAGMFQGSSLGSPGIDEVRWLKPVRPGDTLRVEGEVMEIRASNSKPDRGIVRFTYRYFNQKDEVVLTMSAMQLIRRR